MNQSAMRTAIFCNGFDGIIGKVRKLCGDEGDLIAYLPKPTRTFKVRSPFETELYRIQDNPIILHSLKDLASLYGRGYKSLIILSELGAKRTFLVFLIAMITRARIRQLNPSSSAFDELSWAGLLALLISRGISRRTINTLLLKLSTKFKLARIRAYPLNMHMETVNVCNLRCPACATGMNALGRPQGFMDFWKYERVMQECGPYLNLVGLHLYGEPLLHKQILSFIRSAKLNGVRHVEFSTNANIKMTDSEILSLVKSGLNLLIVSIDGTDQATYEIYRKGGKLLMAIEFVQTIVAAKKALGTLLPVIEIQFIVMKHNMHQIGSAESLAQYLEVDSFRTKMFDATFADIGIEEAKRLLPEGEVDTHYRWVDGKMVSAFATNKNFCPFVWDTATLTWDGHMIPCVFDEKASTVVGDAFHLGNKFMDVWNSDKFVAFRKSILKHRKAIPLCKECPWV